jgi:uncharacterized protein (DUF305 family)
MRKANLGLCVAATLALALPVAAQSSMAGMSGKSMGDMKGMGGIGEMKSMTPTQHEMMTAMHKMNQNMMAVKDKDPDHLFAKQMMAHHQGAVDMSEIELRMGHDEGAKAIARKTAAENRASIAEIEAWLAKH